MRSADPVKGAAAFFDRVPFQGSKRDLAGFQGLEFMFQCVGRPIQSFSVLGLGFRI